MEKKKKSPLSQKSVEELALEIDKALEDEADWTEEELIEYDAEFGYYEDD